jgi:hypothetical protein
VAERNVGAGVKVLAVAAEGVEFAGDPTIFDGIATCCY